MGTEGYAELKKAGSYKIRGWAKFVVKKTKARKAGKGINPFTKEPCIIKARPAGKTVRARAVKAVKNVVLVGLPAAETAGGDPSRSPQDIQVIAPATPCGGCS